MFNSEGLGLIFHTVVFWINYYLINFDDPCHRNYVKIDRWVCKVGNQ